MLATNYKFSLKRSPVDQRDFLLSSVYPINVKLPEVYDLRSDLPPVRDQGNQGSCSAQTAAEMKEWQEKVDVGYTGYFSPQFIYNLRENYGEEGMTPRDTMKILNKVGIVREKDYPYGKIECLDPNTMSSELREEAVKYQISGYARIDLIDGLKKALFANGPCYIAFPVYNPEKMEFWKPDFTGQQMLGGHACFTGDTKISLLDGGELSFKEIHEEFKDQFFWVYSSDPSGNPVPGKAKSLGITRKNARIIKITLDNNEEIKCTEDHEFLLRNGQYKKAIELSINDSLMPLYRKISDGKIKGYEQVLNNITGEWVYTHYMSKLAESEYNKRHNEIIHHMDFNKRNNNPDNLKLMDIRDHNKLHAGLVVNLNKWAQSKEGRKISSDNAKKMWGENKVFREKTLQILRENGTKTINKFKKEGRKNPLLEWQEQNPELAKKYSDENWKKYLEKANTKESKEKAVKTLQNHLKNDPEFKKQHDDMLRKNIQKYNELQKNPEFWTLDKRNNRRIQQLKSAYRRFKYNKYTTFEEYLNKDKGITINSDGIIIPYNHKVKNIEFCGCEDVYDITVEKYHNFALSAGVFVHNCSVSGWLKDSFIVRNHWSSLWGDKGYTYLKFADWGFQWEAWTTIDSDSTSENLSRKATMATKCTKGFFARIFHQNLQK
jgi:intein/homing endonuclease